jgi:hypothetical protein
MYFQTATPDTSGYMIAGYVVAFLVMALYVVSIYVRNRNLHQDMTMLEEMDKPQQPVVEARPRKISPAKSSGNNKSVRPVTKKSRRK